MIGDECVKARSLTKIELTLEQSQQGVSNDVLDTFHSNNLLKHHYYTIVNKIPTHIILVIVPEHPSDTYVLTMKMEILLEPASNKLLVGFIKNGEGDTLFQLKYRFITPAHAQTTKTYYKHRDSRIMKAQELKTKTFAQTLMYKIFLQRYQVYQGRLFASFQDDAKYEHVGQTQDALVAKTIKTEG
ncbi:hypothetical protein Tco_0401947 [Tanacetum coccineum]